MEPRIEMLSERKLVGISAQMSLAKDKTVELWSSFMPVRKLIKNKAGTYFYSMQVYDKSLSFSDFNPQTAFTKWAAIEVSNFDKIPDCLQAYTLQGGLYAVFTYKGRARDFAATWQYIFGQWLPASAYELDQREHFELLDEKYDPNDPESEEEVWIPIRKR
ncbi:transcriptional regulator [Fulvivirga imtechensis AK7]|uniref:Transcriptional regulator n=1 Tax=Fulvivirga imtechensis AK7 TaxID=1237149 RepID=L8JVE3_9BACT|nr:GyrI-like domain-containing protein [Fulvivirga imtechensis]ELR71212.1 transcriptional regulator [Fulvivirga imtechensis AK7]